MSASQRVKTLDTFLMHGGAFCVNGGEVKMNKELFEERKRILLDVIGSREYKPMKLKELAILLNVPKSDRDELAYVLDELVKEGKVFLSKKGKYDKYRATDENIVIGEFTGNKRGFGFVSAEGLEEDIFIPESMTHGAFHKDIVEVMIKPYKQTGEGRKKEGEVIKIISRGIKEVIGTYQKSKNFGFVVADNLRFDKDIFIPKEFSKGAVTGHKVVVRLTDYGAKGRNPEGKIKEIIGHINDPGTDILSIVRAYEIPVEYPSEAMKQAEDTSDRVDERELSGRLDLRELITVTIDGEDAKDLDDAITLSKEGDLYKLGVHIADVSNYVTEGSPLDLEALKRGTSVYLVDRVIPMLPHKLSNGICSLNEGCDRLALSCIMEIDSAGRVVGHKIAETVIRVDRRMSYTNVQRILDAVSYIKAGGQENKADNNQKNIESNNIAAASDKSTDDLTEKRKLDLEAYEEYRDFAGLFVSMKELADILREKRTQRGSIDFDFPESKIYLDDKGVPTDIRPYERNQATRIIEDFMLIANETVAEDFFWQELPFVYRSHENPEPEKMMKLSLFINNFGYGIKTGSGVDGVHPKEIQKLLRRIEGSPQEALISRLTLRSMKQAKYTTTAGGHFGLATKYYCHFTSPIRRYPDLQIHRIIKENLHGGLSGKRISHYNNILPQVADGASVAERRADDAERETEKLKKVQYMSKRIGNIYEGVISGITAYGLYVELPNTVEGMIHVTSLYDDYYYYDDERYEMVGQDSGNVYKLGEKVTVQVVKADIQSRTIDFELALEYNEE